MSKTKAQRLADTARMQKRAEALEKRNSVDPNPEVIKLRAKKRRDHLKICSCPMCCNPRKKASWSHEKESLKERVSKIRMTEE